MKFAVTSFVLFALQIVAAAPPATNLPPIVVTASPIARDEYFTADGAEVVCVGMEQIADLPQQDLPTALRHVPGVSISRYAPVGSYGGAQGGSVYVRGTGESRPGSSLTVFQDDVPAVGSFFNHPIMDLNPIDFADSIEVVKSPRPRTVPNAFSAVNLSTWRQLDDGFSGEADIAYGRFNTLVGSMKSGVKEGAFDVAAGVSYKYSEGKRRHNAAELKNAFTRSGLELGEEEYLSFIYRRAQSWVEDPGAKGRPPPVRDSFETAMDSYAVRLDSEREWMSGYSLIYITDGCIRWHKDHIQDGNLNSPYGWLNTDWQTWGYRGLYDFKWDDAIISVGFDEMVERGRTRTINEMTGKATWDPGGKYQFLSSPYLSARYEYELNDAWTIVPCVGARYYFLDDLNGEWSPSAALTIRREDLEFFLSYARAVHYPGLVFRANTTAWQDIEAETMDTVTLGMKLKLHERLKVHISAFRNEIKNRFDLDEFGQYHNASGLKANGVESSVRFTPTDNLSIYVGATYNIAETHPVSRLPEATGVIGSSWRFLEYLKLEADIEYSSSMYAYTARSEKPNELSKVSCWWSANIRLSCDLKAFLPFDGEIYIAGENVFDRDYEYFPGYAMPGAMVYAGCRWKF